MPSQFIYWPITFPDENPNSPKPDQISLNSVHLPPPPPPPPPPRTRSRKSDKQVTPKRAPQRGLGVAQLERLRMEQADETDLLMHQPRRVMLPHMLVGSYPSPVGSGGGLLTGTYPVGSMGPPGYMGRYLAALAPEPPSTQMVPKPLMPPPVDPVQCYADQCEFCVRKKRLFGESSVYEYVDGGNQMDMDLTATITPSGDLEGGMMRCMERRKETREYQFFPTYGGSLAELAFPMMSDASTSAPSRSAYPSQPIDLSLKLSY